MNCDIQGLTELFYHEIIPQLDDPKDILAVCLTNRCFVKNILG